MRALEDVLVGALEQPRLAGLVVGEDRDACDLQLLVARRAPLLDQPVLESQRFDWSCDYYLKHKRMMPADGMSAATKKGTSARPAGS